MIDMRYKPKFLPQINAPYNIIVDKLNDDGIACSIEEANPNDLNVSQGIVFSDEIQKTNVNDNHPIWIDNSNNVIDGHHRLIKAIYDDIPIKVIKVNLNFKDACRVLNKIQDIYDYENHHEIEEIVNNDIINDFNSADSEVSQEEFLATLEEDNTIVQSENPNEKISKTLVGYRKDDINKNSVVGNFFLLEPVDGYYKFEIEFENLLDTNNFGISYKEGQIPVDILAKTWFPHINFEELGERYKTEPINLKSKAVAHKAQSLGYDGIKYGDKIIQGLG